MPRCGFGTKGVCVCVVLNGEEGRLLRTIYRSNVFFFQAGDPFERMQCVCVTGTAGFSAPAASQNVPLSKTVSQKLLQSSEQSS